MEIDQTIAQQAFDVVHSYFAALNGGDAAGVVKAFNFPHFRIDSKGIVTHYPDANANPLENFRNKTRADGWHHSVLIKMEAIYTSPAKAHVSLTFRRLRADNSEIGVYYSLYIITKIDGHWGIQGGSGNG